MDTYLDLNTVNLLGRVDSRIDKNVLIKKIAKNYGLGGVRKYRQIHEGFEDYNVKLETSSGIYLVKLFSQFKSFRHVKDNVQGLAAFYKAGVRVPKLLKSKKGELLYYYETDQAMALGCVMEYFRGRSFFKAKKEPTIEEMKNITGDIVKINSVKFKPKGIYDVWVVQNLVTEFEKKQRFLSTADRLLMKKVVSKVTRVDYSRSTKGTIHNDIQRSNVLKNSRGDIRIIDFSVMEYGAISIEIATFISLFCINPKTAKSEDVLRIYKEIIGEYLKHKKLSKYDLRIIPVLMLGTYAANCLAASYELRGKENDTDETHYWIDLGSGGMKLIDSLEDQPKQALSELI
ncbi:MAG: phosphotransferase [Candidatus Dojkabacteria bacterium]|nr:phosphotransferase [Candidatus Dojkabacteria bacterium]